MTKQQIFTGFFVLIFIFLFYLFYQVLKPFLISLLWAGILALILYPVYERLKTILRNKSTISSLIMTFLTVCIIVIPLILITASLSIEIFDIYKSAQSSGEFEKLGQIAHKFTKLETLKDFIPSGILEKVVKNFDLGQLNLQEILIKGVGKASNYLLGKFQDVARNLTSFIFNFVIMVFALFFFFRDGKGICEELITLIPMKETEKAKISTIFSNTIDAVIMGSLAIAVVQGLLVGLIFWIMGISYPVIAGAVSFVLSFVPLIGPVVVWAPVGIFLLFTGSIVKGIILLLFGALVISTVDNVLRPLIIGGRVKLPTLFLLLSIIGGIQYFGFSGIVLGPVLLAVFISFIEIYKQTYKELA
ncbi:MAG: AI-2E family transporter [Thermodesulfobacteriota bacterium]